MIATKAGLTRQGPNQWQPVGRPEYLAQQVEMSLRWLRTDTIDLWQLHRIDPKVPVEESLAPIAELQKQGKIRHVGLSEVKPKEIDQARKVINIVSVQNQYNVSDRQHEDVVQYCEKNGLAFIPWFPVAAGALAKPGGNLDTIAKRHGVTVAQLSVAWLLHRSPVMLPIPGTSSVAHLEENMKAAEISLSDTEMKEIEAAIEGKVPHNSEGSCRIGKRGCPVLAHQLGQGGVFRCQTLRLQAAAPASGAVTLIAPVPS